MDFDCPRLLRIWGWYELETLDGVVDFAGFELGIGSGVNHRGATPFYDDVFPAMYR